MMIDSARMPHEARIALASSSQRSALRTDQEFLARRLSLIGPQRLQIEGLGEADVAAIAAALPALERLLDGEPD